jgi:hypothetical protein
MNQVRFLIITMLFIIGFSACNTTDENPLISDIRGVWQDVNTIETDTEITYFRYYFGANNQMQVLQLVSEKATGAVKGYLYRGVGTYHLNGDVLTLNFEQDYLHQDAESSYSNLEDLVARDAVYQDVVTLSWSDDHQLLFIDHPCQQPDLCRGRITCRRLTLP